MSGVGMTLHSVVFEVADEPIVVLAGLQLQELWEDAFVLFATLDALGISVDGSLVHHANVMRSCMSSCVITFGDTFEDKLVFFLDRSELLASDLLDEVPQAHTELWEARRPQVLSSPLKTSSISEKYVSIRLCPEKSYSRYKQAQALFYLGRLDKALFSLEEACVLEPENPASFYHLGCFLFTDLNRAKDALPPLLRARELQGPQVELFRLLGIVYASLDLTHQACECFEMVVLLEPNDFCSWMNLANALQSEDRHQEALQAVAKALQLDPSSEFAAALKHELEGFLVEHSKVLEQANSQSEHSTSF